MPKAKCVPKLTNIHPRHPWDTRRQKRSLEPAMLTALLVNWAKVALAPTSTQPSPVIQMPLNSEPERIMPTARWPQEPIKIDRRLLGNPGRGKRVLEPAILIGRKIPRGDRVDFGGS